VSRATIRAEMTGVKQLVTQLGKVRDRMATESVLVGALTKGAEPIREGASAKAPRRTGRLGREVVIEPIKGEPEVGVFADPFYGHMQEFGTRHHGAQPFMRPAWDENRERALDIVRRELEQEIEKAVQ
jgi:HK97 gp10 family phage protein